MNRTFRRRLNTTPATIATTSGADRETPIRATSAQLTPCLRSESNSSPPLSCCGRSRSVTRSRVAIPVYSPMGRTTHIGTGFLAERGGELGLLTTARFSPRPAPVRQPRLGRLADDDVRVRGPRRPRRVDPAARRRAGHPPSDLLLRRPQPRIGLPGRHDRVLRHGRRPRPRAAGGCVRRRRPAIRTALAGARRRAHGPRLPRPRRLDAPGPARPRARPPAAWTGSGRTECSRPR